MVHMIIAYMNDGINYFALQEAMIVGECDMILVGIGS
jgi:hypothetical protein